MQLRPIDEMSHTHAKANPTPGDFRQIKTVFYSETNSGARAVLVTSFRGKEREEAMSFADPHLALSWCQSHDANFVYARATPERN